VEACSAKGGDLALGGIELDIPLKTKLAAAINKLL